MGSSSRKRSAKKADFTKPKLKVGKARPKPSNFTDTSFKSRSIAVPTQQSLHTTPPTAAASLLTHLSHLKSHTASLRADHLAALHALLLLLLASSSSSSSSSNTNTNTAPPLPLPPSTLLTALTPLLLDPSNRVRAQLLLTLPLLPAPDLADHVPTMLPYIRAAITSLSPDIRLTGLEALGWMCADPVVVGRAVVGSAGGWVRGVKCLAVVLGWGVEAEQGGRDHWGRGKKVGGGAEWTEMNAVAGGGGGSGGGGGGGGQGKLGGGVSVKALGTLAAFLRCGLLPEKRGAGEEVQMGSGRALGWPLWNVQAHMLPDRPNAYGYLNLFGEKRDEEGEVYEDAEDRRRVFRSLGYEAAISRGVEAMRKEGGEVGRAAGILGKVLKEAEDLAE